MSVLVIGVNQRTAPLSLLERFAVAGDRQPKFLDALVASDHISEALILSTCHRTEIWVVAEKFHGAVADVRDVLCDLTYLPPDAFSDHLNTDYDLDAVRYLFEVSTGLQSVVVGEHEILGQVAAAWETGRSHGSVGPTLNLLFRHAIEVGKRARTETAISRSITSVSHAAVVMAAEEAGALKGRSVAVVGAGAMGRGMVGLLSEQRLDRLVVLNRSPQRAAEVAATCGADSASLDELARVLGEVDVVFSSTGSPDVVITADMVRDAVARRAERGVEHPLVLVDIAMPRDVAGEVASLDGVRVLDMEALDEFAARGLRQRRGEVPAVHAIIEAELERFESVRSSRSVAPLVAELRERADSLRTAELDRHRARLAELDPATQELVEAVTRGVVAKLLHTPTVAVKDAAGTPRGDRLAQTLRDLFDL